MLYGIGIVSQSLRSILYIQRPQLCDISHRDRNLLPIYPREVRYLDTLQQANTIIILRKKIQKINFCLKLTSYSCSCQASLFLEIRSNAIDPSYKRMVRKRFCQDLFRKDD
ncbi:hypothetical protein PUN28_004577 [Cardiocondyla obscurior]|uniref:Uncharacterized protein n=1 Tax=Cardiocondyla obscurior TaxID=286306 RepID=A0AAW2GD75_9HYME